MRMAWLLSICLFPAIALATIQAPSNPPPPLPVGSRAFLEDSFAPYQNCENCSRSEKFLRILQLRQRFDALGLPLAQDLMPLPGFYAPEDSRFPEGVRSAADSVLKVFVITSYRTAPTEELNQFLHDPNTARLGLHYHYMKFYLNRCLRESQQSCAIPLARDGGSAVIAGSEHILFTSMHVVLSTFLKSLESTNEVERVHAFQASQEALDSQEPLPWLVMDKRGNVVSTPDFQPLRVRRWGERFLPEFLRRTGQNFLPIDDYVELVSEGSLGKPLAIATEIPAKGENIFHLGWPTCTGCYDRPAEKQRPDMRRIHFHAQISRYPFPDADGESQAVTVGKMMEELENTVLLDSADAVGGMSGGAMVDQRGALLGFSSAIRNMPARGFYSVRPGYWSTLRPSDQMDRWEEAMRANLVGQETRLFLKRIVGPEQDAR